MEGEGRTSGNGCSLLAGLAGGGLVGLTDAAVAVLGHRPTGATVALLLLGLAVGAAAGAGLVLFHAIVARALRRALAGRSPARGLETRIAAWAAVALALPVATYDAFALFEGARASTLPGRHALSVALAVAALVALFFLARRVGALLSQVEGRARRPAQAWLLAAALVGLAAATYQANRMVLPRLYPWFHATLTLGLGVAVVLAVRFVLAGLVVPSGNRATSVSTPAALVAALAVVASAALALPAVRGEQAVLFLAHQHTQVTGPALRALRLPLRARAASGPRLLEPAPATAPAVTPAVHSSADIVLITVDALRADHVGAYGYVRPTTPSIDALARQGVRFERAYAQAPHTSFSVASLLTGTYYAALARLPAGVLPEPISTALRRHGWRTAAFYPPAVFFVDREKLQSYAQNHYGFEHVRFDYASAQDRLAQVVQFLEAERSSKAFVWVHFFEPHEPYDVCPKRDFGPRDRDRYDSEIACVDQVVGRLLRYLDRERPGAIVVLTADHGEEFDEHGGRYHGSTLYDEQVRVPLILRFPGVTPHVVAGQVQLVDLKPTILGLVGVPATAPARGLDLAPWLVSPPAAAALLPPAFAEFEDKRMVLLGEQKLICDMNWGVCAYHDLRLDPGERSNEVDRHSERVALLRGHLDRWLDDQVRFASAVRGPGAGEDEDVPAAIERARMGDLGVVLELAALLQSGQRLWIRQEAARLLVTRLPRRPETRALVEAALRAEDPVIRDWAALAATRLGHRPAAARARQILGSDRGDPELRLQAALALAKVGDGDGVPALVRALASCDSVELCRRIVLSLGALRDRRATAALVEQLPSIQNRREVVNALGEIGDPAALPALIDRLLHDEFVPVRAEAATALAKIGGDPARRALDSCLAREREPVVLAAARRAAGALERSPTGSATAPAAMAAPGQARRARPDRARRR